MRKALNIVMSGATGFLGSHLLDEILRDGHSVTILKRRSSNLFRIQHLQSSLSGAFNIEDVNFHDLFERSRFDLVLHCATEYGRKNTDTAQLAEANLILPIKMLQEAKRFGCRAFINTDTVLDKGISAYTLSKKQFCEWLEASAQDLSCINVALEHFYGAGDDKTKFVSWLIHELVQGDSTIPLTPGEQKRDFIHIDDVVRAFMAIIQNLDLIEKGFHRFAIGTGSSISLREFCTLAASLAKTPIDRLKFGALPYRANEFMESSVNIERLRQLGWEPKLDVSEGLAQMIRDEAEGVGT